jgi:hypothetical protein
LEGPIEDNASRAIFTETTFQSMSILNNNKKQNDKQQGSNKNTNNNSSKFIKPSSKSPGVAKKVRSTGANRGS